jgi:hypothetical protein
MGVVVDILTVAGCIVGAAALAALIVWLHDGGKRCFGWKTRNLARLTICTSLQTGCTCLTNLTTWYNSYTLLKKLATSGYNMFETIEGVKEEFTIIKEERCESSF